MTAVVALLIIAGAVGLALALSRPAHHDSSWDVAQLIAPSPELAGGGRQVADHISRHRRQSPAGQGYTARCATGWAARDHFIEAHRVSVNSTTVTMIGRKGYVRCGGPNDIGYFTRPRQVHLTITPSTVITHPDFTTTPSGVSRISAEQLKQYLRVARAQHDISHPLFFGYTGPESAVRTLDGLYHP
jgi:hypothetical protein